MLRIGLVSRAGESEGLKALLAERGVAVALERTPAALSAADIASRAVAVWLVHLGEEDWTEAVDRLLDEAAAPVFIDEPETLAGHAYPAYWARSLAERLQELAGAPAEALAETEPVELPEELDFSLAELAEDEDLLGGTPTAATEIDAAVATGDEQDAALPELGALEFAFDAPSAGSGRIEPSLELATMASDPAADAFALDWDLTPGPGAEPGLSLEFDAPLKLPTAPEALPPAADMTGIEEVELRWSAEGESLLMSDEPAPAEILELEFPADFAADPAAMAARSSPPGELFAFELAPAEAPIAPWQLVVLAASLGGPAAVKRFLQALPGGLPAVFVLAQHIDPGFLPVLARALETASPYQVVMVEGSHDLAPGQLVLVPVASRLNFAHGGLVTTSPAHWTPPYAPCINDVMEDVAKVYERAALCIVFSGMGDDGAAGGQAVLAHGGQVWAQDAESCANSSMPDSARAAGVVSFTGTPEELARHCADHLGHRGDAAAVNH